MYNFKKIIVIGLLYFAFAQFSFAQIVSVFEKRFNYAVAMVDEGKFEEALPILHELDSIRDDLFLAELEKDSFVYVSDTTSRLKIWIKFYLGKVYIQHKYLKKKAIPYFQYCLDAEFPDLPSSIYYYLGEAYYGDYKFVTAKNYYTYFVNFADANDTLIPYCKKMIIKSEFAEQHIKNNNKVLIKSFGELVNSNLSEEFPVVNSNLDKLVLLRRNYDAKGEIIAENIMLSKKFYGMWEYPDTLFFDKSNLYTTVYPLTFTANSDSIYVFASSENNNHVYKCYIDTLARTLVSELCELPDLQNRKLHSVSIAPNGTTIFLSLLNNDNYDIFFAEKVSSEKWTKIEALQHLEVNTEANEIYPSWNMKRNKLLFSSDREQTLGEYDVFSICLNNTKEAKNLDYPLNSIFDDWGATVLNTGFICFSANNGGNTRNIDLYFSTELNPLDSIVVLGNIWYTNNETYSQGDISVATPNSSLPKNNVQINNGYYKLELKTDIDYQLCFNLDGLLSEKFSLNLKNTHYYSGVIQHFNISVDTVGQSCVQKTILKSVLPLVSNFENNNNEIETLLNPRPISYHDFEKLLEMVFNSVQTGNESVLRELDAVTIHEEFFEHQTVYNCNDSIADRNRSACLNNRDKSPDISPMQDFTGYNDDFLHYSETELKEKNIINNDSLKTKSFIFSYYLTFDEKSVILNRNHLENLNKISNLILNNKHISAEIIGYGDTTKVDMLEFGKRTENIILNLAQQYNEAIPIIKRQSISYLSKDQFKHWAVTDNDKNVLNKNENLQTGNSLRNSFVIKVYQNYRTAQ